MKQKVYLSVGFVLVFTIGVLVIGRVSDKAKVTSPISDTAVQEQEILNIYKNCSNGTLTVSLRGSVYSVEASCTKWN